MCLEAQKDECHHVQLLIDDQVSRVQVQGDDDEKHADAAAAVAVRGSQM